MKSVKFKDLPDKVRGFISRLNGAIYDENLDWLHEWDKWSLATDDERLAYAEWMYKFGVRLKDAYDDEEYDLKLRDTIFYLEKDPRSPHDIMLTRNEHHTDITIYDSDKKKWAEIIEEPDALTKAKQALHDHIQSNPEKVKQDLDKMRDLSNEFKAGDEVDGQHNSRFYTDESFIYTGGKNTKGEFICEQKVTGRLFAFTEIRKIDPDKVYREIAKEIIGNARVHEFTSIEYITVESAESMLIEALKKGKGL